MQHCARGIAAGSSSSEVRIHDNTVFNNDAYEIMVSGASSDVTMKNNILFDDQVGSQDIHLQAGSAAIDQGTTDIAGGVTAPAVYFDAEERPHGAGIDIGADEAHP